MEKERGKRGLILLYGGMWLAAMVVCDWLKGWRGGMETEAMLM